MTFECRTRARELCSVDEKAFVIPLILSWPMISRVCERGLLLLSSLLLLSHV